MTQSIPRVNKSRRYPTFQIPLLTLCLIYIPPIFIILTVLYVHLMTQKPIEWFLRDPSATMQVNPIIGVQSNLGILAWSAGASVSWFTSVVQYQIYNSRKSKAYFWAYSGFITTVLMLDDLFLFHEDLAGRYFHLSDKKVYLIYLILVMIYLVKFRAKILRSDYILLLLALAFFFLSIVLDTVTPNIPPSETFYEDGLKLLGIVSWSAYLIRTAIQSLVQSASDQPELAGAVSGVE